MSLKRIPAGNLWKLIISVIGLTACSQDIEVVRPGNPMPVLYAVFDPNERVNEARLSKTFAGKSDPAVLATDPGLLFYEDARICVEGTGIPGSACFTRISDQPRDTGYFPPLPNVSYRLDRQLYPGDYMMVAVTRPGGDTVRADFRVMQGLRVVLPKQGFRRLHLYEDPLLFSWSEHPEAGLFEIAIRLDYEETLLTGATRFEKAVYTRLVRLSELERADGRLNYRFYSDPFFASLHRLIKADDRVDFRRPLGLELTITAADTLLARYMEWFASAIGDQVNPYGNVSQGIGIVASKSSVRFSDLILSPRAQDSLIRGRHTRHLNFAANPDW